MQATINIAALDIGEVRIGVAKSVPDVRIAKPYGVIANDGSVVQSIADFISNEWVDVLVIGLPRGLQGQETDQTKYVRDFVARLREVLAVPFVFQDEALTSQKAEQELQARGKPYEKGEIDALAATYILQDYLDAQELQRGI